MTLPATTSNLPPATEAASLLFALQGSTPGQILEFCDSMDQIGAPGIAEFSARIRSYAMNRAAE
jgi:hypothetical protein